MNRPDFVSTDFLMYQRTEKNKYVLVNQKKAVLFLFLKQKKNAYIRMYILSEIRKSITVVVL